MAKRGNRIKWEDTTCYQQGERRAGVEPRSWALPMERLCILVHRCRPEEGQWFAPCYRLGEQGQWFLSCYQLGIERLELDEDLDVAKVKAVKEVQRRLSAMLSDVEKWQMGADK